MAKFVTLSDGKTHRITDNARSSVRGHWVQTACGCHIRERQENVDVYMSEESPELEDLCSNCDHAGYNSLPAPLKN